MGKALPHPPGTRGRTARKLDWRKRMSDHVAYALLVYTGLQIFVTLTALKHGHGSALPYFALVILVAAIVPGCRAMEARWDCLSDSQAANPELADAFKRDRSILWACALGLPFALTAGFKGMELLV